MTNVSQNTTPVQGQSLQPSVGTPNQAQNYGAVKPRQPLLGVVVGRKFVGKTYTTNLFLYKYVTGQLKTGAHARKVLILDVNDEFQHIKAIALKDVIRFSASNIIEPRRIRIWKEDGTKMNINDIVNALSTILNTFFEGLLLVEDISKYISDNLPLDLIGAICTQRHVGCDVIMHFQGIGAIVPKIWRNCNYVRFHKNNESVEKHKDKFPDKEEPLKIVEALVNAQVQKGIAQYGEEDGQRFFIFYDVEEEKIKGEYSQLMLWEAIMKYLSENYNQTIRPMVSGFDLSTGKKLNPDVRLAVQTKATELFKLYYGNGMPIKMG